MARDEYDHLRESSDLAKGSKFVLVDQINSQAFGLFDSPTDAINAALTGADSVGGVPWGDDGWEVVTLTQFKADHDEEGASATYTNIGNVEANRAAIIAEIADEIDSGNAHLLTRNELVEFMVHIVDGDEFSDAVYELQNHGHGEAAMEKFKAFAEDFAKRWFVECGYER